MLQVFVFGQDFKLDHLGDGYFTPPVNHRISLSGNFCELRNNHFHAGLDFRSARGVEGDDILATAKGYISRIKIESGNYGNAIYINHPCGLTSVYAHLQKFRPDIAAYVHLAQLESETFEIDICPDTTTFRVNQGEVIGQMGNTGHSFGPHLHFEIRDTKTQIALNPVQFGLNIEDERPPTIENLAFEALDQRLNPIGQTNIPLKASHGGFVSLRDTVEIPAWRGGFVVAAYDRQNNSSFKNGVYKIEVIGLDSTIFKFEAEQCSFDETRQMNAHVDYARRITTGQWAHRCHILPNNTLSMYDTSLGNGVIMLYEGKPQPIGIVLSDFHGNESHIKLFVKRKKQEVQPKQETFHAAFKFDKANFYSTPELSLLCPSDALFSDVNLVFAPALDSLGKLTAIKVGAKTIPTKRNLILHINQHLVDTNYLSKAVLIYKDHRTGKDCSAGASMDSTGLSISLPYLGLYQLEYDSVSPSIASLTNKRSFSRGETIKFKIKDNFEVIGLAREMSISQWLNNEWIVGTFDLKSNTLSIPIQDSWTTGIHTLKIRAEDDKNNSTERAFEISIN